MVPNRTALLFGAALVGFGCSTEDPTPVESTQGTGGASGPTGGTGLVAGDGSITGGTGGDANGGTDGTGLGGDTGFGGLPIGGAPGEGELLTSLSPDRERALCLEIQDYLNTPEVLTLQHEMDCRSSGFQATAGSMPPTEEAARSMCQGIYDSCLATAMPTVIGDCVDTTPACTATVGDLFACWHTIPAQLMLALDGVPSCSALTLADLELTVRPSPPPSAACQAFDSKCPSSGM